MKTFRALVGNDTSARHLGPEAVAHDAVLSTEGETRRRVVRGATGLLLVYLTLSVLYVAATPPLFHVVESGNVAYALSLAEGELPTMDTPIATEEFPELQRRVEHDRAIGRTPLSDVWMANHPPLFYLLAAAPIGVGVQFDVPLAGLWVAKGLNVLLGAGVVVATVALARALVPGSPRVALIAGGWLVMVPLLTTEPAGLYNDFLAVLTATGLLASAVSLIRRGRTSGRVALVALWASAAALTRVSGLLFVGVAVCLTMIGAAAAHEATRQRIAAALRDGTLVLIAVALTSGWFYWRNAILHGGITGAPENRIQLGFESDQSVWGVLTGGEFWGRQVLEVFAGAVPRLLNKSNPFGFADATLAPGPTLLFAIVLGVLTGLLVVPPLVFALRSGVGQIRSRGPRPDLIGFTPWLFMGACVPVIVFASASHASHGGNPHGRYLLQVLPLVAVAVGVAWARFSKRSGSGPILVTLGLALIANLVFWLLFAHVRYGVEELTNIVSAAPLRAALSIPGSMVLVPLGVLALLLGATLYVRAVREDPVSDQLRPRRGADRYRSWRAFRRQAHVRASEEELPP